MFDELRKKLHALKVRITKKQQPEPITLTPPILQDDNLPFTLETYLDGNMKVLKLSEYIPVTKYVEYLREHDEHDMLNSISNNILWNGGKQKVNKGIYFVIYDANRIYNILIQDGKVDVDERIKYEDGKTDERILHLDPTTGFYRYSSLKHDETGSTYYTKFYNKNGVDMEFFALPFEEAYADISSMIANLQITPEAPRAVSIKTLNELVLQDMEKHPQLKKQ